MSALVEPVLYFYKCDMKTGLAAYMARASFVDKKIRLEKWSF